VRRLIRLPNLPLFIGCSLRVGIVQLAPFSLIMENIPIREGDPGGIITVLLSWL
jgi:hypothetical protein